MEKVKRRKYDKEFKINTVKMILNENRKVREIARDLDIVPEVIYKWKRQYMEDHDEAFPGEGHLKAEDEEIRRLRRKLAEAEEERDILKKAVAIFSVRKQHD